MRDFKARSSKPVLQSPFVRELVVPCRGSGCVALYEIEGQATVNILVVRRQREDDHH